MTGLVASCIIAFAMYSKIPMPKIDWSEKNMRYVMCFFPLVGVILGVAQKLLFEACRALVLGDLMRSVLLAALPILVTGGIHMDGLMDTMDARGSWGDQEKKLAILKDSHTGAFAILGCCVYLMFWTAAWSEITEEMILSAAECFVYARILSGLSVTVFQCARNSGLAATFHGAAHKRAVRNTLSVELVLCAAAMLATSPVYGAAMLASGALCFLWYRWFSYRDFGGITGDLAGYFLTICELVQILSVIVVHLVLQH